MTVNNFINNLFSTWQQRYQQQPLFVTLVSLIICSMLFYVMILLPLNNTVDTAAEKAKQNYANAVWMNMAASEILKLRKITPNAETQTSSNIFTIINQQLKQQGWDNDITNLSQIEQNKVQLSFKQINANDLITWLQQLVEAHGVKIESVNLVKLQPEIIEANMVFSY